MGRAKFVENPIMRLAVAIQMDHVSSIDIDADSTFMLAMEAQDRGHGLFHYEPDDRNPDRLIERNLTRVHETTARLPRNQKRHDAKHDGAREPAQNADLPSTEGVARAATVATREPIGEGRDAQRRSMARHVPAVGEQGH